MYYDKRTWLQLDFGLVAGRGRHTEAVRNARAAGIGSAANP